MNTRQRVLLYVIAIIQICISVYVPWEQTSSYGNSGFHGYHYIWNSYGTIISLIYFIEWSALLTIGFIAYHLLKDKH